MKFDKKIHNKLEKSKIKRKFIYRTKLILSKLTDKIFFYNIRYFFNNIIILY